MRAAVAMLLVLPLSGCWFFMVPLPSSLFEAGNACAAENVAVGQRLKHTDGRSGKVEKVIGRHQRCQSARMPVLVEIVYDEAK